MIKLRHILLHEDIVDDVFGEVPFGGDDSARAFQNAKFEPNTPAEDEIWELLRKWAHGLATFYRSEKDSDVSKDISKLLYDKKDVFVAASKRFPNIFKPSTENGSELYRGLKRGNPALDGQLAKVDKNSYEKITFGSGTGTYWKYKNPIDYSPRSEVQSWTSEKRIAILSSWNYFLSTAQNDEFLMNQRFMELFGYKEYETLHFGTEYTAPVYVILNDRAFKRLYGETDD